MAHRTREKQSSHDAAVGAAANIYRQNDKYAVTNPGNEQNQSWSGYYIDVIAKESEDSNEAWLIEVETDDSVSESEAEDQWSDYDDAFSVWYLAVPKESQSDAKSLLSEFDIENANIVTWVKNDDGTHTFWGLPGV